MCIPCIYLTIKELTAEARVPVFIAERERIIRSGQRTSCECAHSVARYSDLKNQSLTKSRTFRNFLKKRVFFVKKAQRDIIQTVFAFILHIVGQFFREMANFLINFCKTFGTLLVTNLPTSLLCANFHGYKPSIFLIHLSFRSISCLVWC